MIAILEENAPRIKAAKVLEEIEQGKIKITDMDYDAIFETVMTATGSERLANSYRVAAIKAQTWKPR